MDEHGRFLIPTGNYLDLVARQALYEWVSQSISNQQVSYDLWKRVSSRLTDYPQNRQWTLELGSGWNLRRIGDALETFFAADDNRTINGQQSDDPLTILDSAEEISWSYEDDATEQSTLAIILDPGLSNSSFRFVKSTAGAGKSNVCSWKFTPPSRKGRSPLKLLAFLRGQKVPLHLRESTPIIYFQSHTENASSNFDNAESLLVAVFLNNKWVVDSAWNPSTSDTDMMQLFLSI